MKKTSPDGDYFLRFYLHSDPFPVTERDDLFFLTDALKRRLDAAARAVTDAGKVAIVTAAAGGGKSAFARRLAGHIAPPWSATIVEAQAGWDTETLAAALVEDLVPAELAPLPPVPRVYKFLESCDRSGTRPVILVDDAHLLSDAALKFLLQMSMQRYNASRLGFVLLGEDALIERIEDLALVPGENLCTVSIPAFSRDATRDYIVYRLEACGLTRKNPVEDADMARIHRITGGLPGGIHCLAREILIDRSRSRGARGARQVPLLIVLLLALGTGAYIYIRHATPPGLQRVTQIAPAPDPVPAKTPEAAAPLRHPPEAESGPTPPGLPPATPAGEIFATQAGDAAVSTGTTVAMPAEAVMTAALAPDPPVAAPAAKPDVAGDAVVTPDPAPVETEAVDPETPGPAPAVTVATPAIPDDGFTPMSVDPSWREGLRGPDWIRQQPEGSYFLQLINASDLGNARRLLERLARVRGDLAAYTNYTPSGRPRYLVLYGVWPDRAAAEAAIAEVPPEVRSIPPWPRARSGVVRDMENAEARGLDP